jgi:hypothetical protein
MRKESFPRSSAGAQSDESRSERHGEPRLSIEEHCRTASICVAAMVERSRRNRSYFALDF